MKLIFVGHKDDPTEAAECEVMGIVFPRGTAVPVTKAVFDALSNNPAFTVEQTHKTKGSK